MNPMNQIILGVDPGIANTGLAVVGTAGGAYQLIDALLVRTKPSEKIGARLAAIRESLEALLDAWDIHAIAIERVFHNKNVSSSLTTGAVVGLVHLVAHQREIPVAEFTPQQVKRAAGLGGSLDKAGVKRMACRILGASLTSHHEADAALCALAGMLNARLDRRAGTQP